MTRGPGPESGAAWTEARAAWAAGAREVWLPTADEMAALDRRAREAGATTERTLIETAGRGVARQIARRWPEGPVVGLLGSGHNGADALVALRTLQAWGRDVRAVVCGSSRPEPDVTAGHEIRMLDRDAFPGVGAGASVLVDGLLGTGVRGAPREPQAAVIRAANELAAPVVAVDGPSGIDFTTGNVPGDCVRADLTVALGWPNLGLVRFPGRRFCGDVVAVEIGFPPAGGEEFGARAVTAGWVRELLVGRAPDAHKGDAGYLALVAGQEGMAGASVLAARSAARGGAGIVRVVGAPGNRVVVQTAVPDAVFSGWDDEGAVREAVEWADALVVGPGLGRGAERRELVERVLSLRGERPVLLDADGLTVWEGALEPLADALDGNALLTPHPGELARLLEVPVAEILEDPLDRARAAASATGATVLLKGSPSVVAAQEGPVRIAATAGPEVASGGSGDVLSGLAGAYLAAGLSPADAGSAALLLSGVAASRSPVPEGHLASDVPDRLPGVRAELEDLPPRPRGSVRFRLPAPHG